MKRIEMLNVECRMLNEGKAKHRFAPFRIQHSEFRIK